MTMEHLAIALDVTGGTLLAIACLIVAARRRRTQQPPVAVHIGATEAYGDELRQTRDSLPSVDLRTTGEQMAVDHDALSGISDAIALCDERVMHALRLFCGDDLELFMQLTRYDAGTLAETGQFDRRELEALLAADELVGATR